MSYPQLDALCNARENILNKSSQPGAVGYLNQEILRFITITGTILDFATDENFGVGEKPNTDSRGITHPLIRSLMEGFFINLYIFDKADQNDITERYKSLAQSFYSEYTKMLNEPLLKQFQLPNPILHTQSAPKLLNVASMLDNIKSTNKNTKNLGPLYAWYRISSFDTHAKACENLTTLILGSDSVFPFIKADQAIEMMAEAYLVLHQNS